MPLRPPRHQRAGYTTAAQRNSDHDERRGTWIYYRLDAKTAARIAKLGHLLTAGATREPKRVSGRPVPLRA